MSAFDLDRAIRKFEAGAKYPSGIGQIQRGQCELGATSSMTCIRCGHGHMIECHYPLTCEQAGCKH